MAAPLICPSILASDFARLGEEVRAFRISAVALGMCGVLIVLWPRLTLSREGVDHAQAMGAMLVLTGAVFAALAQVFVRKMVATEKTPAIVFWFSLTSTLGQILLTSSYREADASLVAPFDYASMLFALAIGYFIFAEVTTLPMLGGASLIITAGILIIWRERRLGLERARQRKAMTP